MTTASQNGPHRVDRGFPALLAVAHGTAERAGIDELGRLVTRVRVLAPELRVELAYVDHEPPSVRAALAALAGEAVPVAVVPLLLTAAAHSKTDIAGAVRQARVDHPGFAVAYGRPLGVDPLLLGVLTDRVTAAGAGPDTALVIAAAGSAAPDANAEIFRVARLVWEYRGTGAPVEVAYASATTPTVTDAVDRLRRLGHEDIVVVPYFLAPGRLPAAVVSDARTAGARVAGVLGAHEDVARVLLVRYREAVAGSVVMNCDTCFFRAPWPGHEHRVGAPQRPHVHPLDH